MKTLQLLLVLGALSLGGCATQPTGAEMARADFGPVPADAEAIIRAYMRTVLKDPDSAKYDMGGLPRRGWVKQGETRFGWVYCPQINARNSFGAYVGFRPSYFLISQGRIVDAAHGDGNYGDMLVQAKCRG